MSGLAFQVRPAADRFGLKGPRAAEWLSARGLELPAAPNTWASSTLLVARLGTGEFFLEDAPGGAVLRGLVPAADTHPPGVYPVLREDAAFLLSGDGSADVLAQICNVNFAELDLGRQPVIMTSMIGVSVLVVSYDAADEQRHRIWCDPTFARYLEGTIGHIVMECGGNYTGVSV
jgi:sarcosine oxidase subunit gamma